MSNGKQKISILKRIIMGNNLKRNMEISKKKSNRSTKSNWQRRYKQRRKQPSLIYLFLASLAFAWAICTCCPAIFLALLAAFAWI